MLTTLKKWYKKNLFHSPFTLLIYAGLESAVNLEAKLKKFSFPSVYIRAWKLDMLRERYEKNTTDLFKKILKPGMTVVDIGAHVGYFTRLFAKKVGSSGRVFAFEPDPSNFSLLKKNTVHYKNIIINQLAVSHQNGTINFYHSDVKTGCHSTIPSSFRQTKLTVEAITLDDFCQKHNIECVDVIKIDIEGGETAALQGMRRVLVGNQTLAIVTEFNPECLGFAKIEPTKFLKDLADLGFTIFALSPCGLIKINVDATMDYMNYQDYLGNASFVNIFCTKTGQKPPFN